MVKHEFRKTIILAEQVTKLHVNKISNSRKRFVLHAVKPNSNLCNYSVVAHSKLCKQPADFQDSNTDFKSQFLRELHRSDAGADHNMEIIPTNEDQEQAKELLSSLASVYKLYGDNLLQEFVDAAEMWLDEDVELSRPGTIHLLILLANSVEGSEDTREYYDLARAEYCTAQLNHQKSADGIRAVGELGARLDRIREVVGAERAEEAEKAIEAEVVSEDTIEDSE